METTPYYRSAPVADFPAADPVIQPFLFNTNCSYNSSILLNQFSLLLLVVLTIAPYITTQLYVRATAISAILERINARKKGKGSG